MPLALTSGYALNVGYEKLRDYQQEWLFVPVCLTLGVFCGYQLYQLNFVHYDDDVLPYVYAHTKLQMLYQGVEGEYLANAQRRRELTMAGHGQFQSRFQPHP